MEILKHETEIDITHKLNTYELDVWLKHLKLIEEEIEYLEKMWVFDVDGVLEDKFVLQQILESRRANKSLQKQLESYTINKPNELLCENFQCDVDLISEHEQYRDLYLNYLMPYRNLKNKIYRLLNGKPATSDLQAIKYG